MSTPDIMSKFMRKVEDGLKARELSDATIKAYMSRLRLLNAGRAFSSFAFLKDIPAIDAIIAKGAENTQKNFYSAILSCTQDYKTKKTYRKAIDYYERKFKTTSDTIKAELQTHKKSETQEANWITWPEVIKVRDALEEKVSKIDVSGSVIEEDYNTILSNVILALYTYIQPRRNKDFMYMKLAYFSNVLDLPKTNNYYDIQKQRLVFNEYKTDNKYGQQIIDISGNTGLITALDIYLKVHRTKIPQEANNYMFVLLLKFGGEEFKQDYDITRNLNKTFGKNVAATMLRHIYITHEHGGTLLKREQDAKNMAHSLSTQLEYIKI